MFVCSILATKLVCSFRYRFLPQTKLIIEEQSLNASIFDAAQIYLPTRINNHKIAIGQPIADQFDGIPIQWLLISTEDKFSHNQNRSFELNFPTKFEDQVLGSYLRHVEDTAAEIKKQNPIAEESPKQDYHFNYMISFDSLVMDPKLKRFLVDDLDQFLQRRDHYRELRETWKRGYLFAGPATGKSLLIEAISNYMKFDDFHYRLADIYTRKIMQKVISSHPSDSDAPVLVTVDIDSTADDNSKSLSDNLFLLDILWSCSGDNKIIILTTKNTDPLDPALLQLRCWMDVHLNLSRRIKLPMKYPKIEGDTDSSRLGHPEIDKEQKDEDESKEQKDESKEQKKKQKRKKRKRKRKRNEKNQPIGWMLWMRRLFFNN